MDKRFDYQNKEKEIYSLWEKEGYFSPEKCIEKGVTSGEAEPFSMVLPPPNVTGVLHMGHAAMLAIQDILVRYNRMKGKRTLWIPGTDHAAIATQSKVEKEIYKKEKKSRHDLGRAELLKRIEEFAKESHDTIESQIKAMGASLDWSREAFTLDNKRNHAVNYAFKKMYDDKLIYQGDRIVNWDPKGQTTISDDEVIREDETTKFYYLKYGPFVIGTSRPETKFGDKYVVVHPEDKRYEKYKHGEEIELEWINGPIKATIIKDEAIDMEFGTGAMTITPWHDSTDFEIAERHNLDKEQIIDKYGKLLPIASEFAGMKIKEAREKIIEKLQEKRLVEKIDENYNHKLAIAERTGGIIEPQIMKQWFIDVNKEFEIGDNKIGIDKNQKVTLKDLMTHVVESNQIEILPDRFKKIYFHWIENLRDWCISRQIWYGHRIPVWYHDPVCIPKPGRESEVGKCKEVIISGEKPECQHCDAEYKQDPDTLDTWFSSSLWTFSTLGWPEETEDLKMYHPTNILETGYDTIFFWVARMILMSTYHLGDIPFKNVYFHGMVLDEKGKKMSKSKGNAMDPLDMIEKFGADATRLSLIMGVGSGNDINLSEDKVKNFRNFSTKVWNVARFLEMNRPEKYSRENADNNLLEEDQLKIKEVKEVKDKVSKHIEKFEFNLASEKAYDFLWNDFANKLLEETKPRLQNENEKLSAYRMLEIVFFESIKTLHPFIPYITEAVYKELNLGDKMLLVENW